MSDCVGLEYEEPWTLCVALFLWRFVAFVPLSASGVCRTHSGVVDLGRARQHCCPLCPCWRLSQRPSTFVCHTPAGGSQVILVCWPGPRTTAQLQTVHTCVLCTLSGVPYVVSPETIAFGQPTCNLALQQPVVPPIELAHSQNAPGWGRGARGSSIDKCPRRISRAAKGWWRLQR